MHSFEAPRPQGGASRARSGEQNVSQGNFLYIVPLDPAYPARAGRGTCRSTSEWDLHRIQSEGVFFRREIGREVDELLTLVNRVSAPLMALRTIRSPFF
jgi:hypothetical protein